MCEVSDLLSMAHELLGVVRDNPLKSLEGFHFGFSVVAEERLFDGHKSTGGSKREK